MAVPINDTFREFYSQLYTSQSQADTNTIINFLSGLDIPRISLELAKDWRSPYLKQTRPQPSPQYNLKNVQALMDSQQNFKQTE